MVGRSRVGWLAATVMVELAVAVGAVACGDTAPKAASTAGIEAVAPTTTGPPVPPPDPVVGDVVPVGYQGGSVAVLGVEPDVNAGRLFPAPKGRQHYAAHVEGCAGPEERGLSFDDSYFLLELADQAVFASALPVKKPDLLAADLPAGKCVDGWVTFVIPDDAEPVSVVYDGSTRIKWRIPADPSEPPQRSR